MLQRYKIFPLLLLLAIFVSSCDDDPTSGSNGVPNAITGKARLIDGDTEKPLDDHSGVQVSLRGTTFNTTTNAAGEYTFNAVPPGIYVITFAKPDFDSTMTRVEYSGVGVEFADEVTLSSNKKIHRVEGIAHLLLYYGDTITNLSDIHVTIAGTSFSTTTDASGHYSFTNLAAGTYEARFTYAGFDTAKVPFYYSGTGVMAINDAYLYSRSFVSITLAMTNTPNNNLIYSYSDSVRNGKVWIGGIPLDTARKYLIVLGGAVGIDDNALQFKLQDDDPLTNDELVVPLASTVKTQFIKYYDYNQIKSYLDGVFAGKVVTGRMSGFAQVINMEIHSNSAPIPRE
jgi:hypothetical protein